jgi:hypothetical protein
MSNRAYKACEDHSTDADIRSNSECARRRGIHHMELHAALNIIFLALAAALARRAGRTGGFGR